MRDAYSIETLRAAGVDVASGLISVELCEGIVFGNSQIGRRIVRDSSSRVVGVVLMMGDVTVEHNHCVLPHMLEMFEQRFGSDCRIKLIPFYNFWKFDVTLPGELCEELGFSIESR